MGIVVAATFPGRMAAAFPITITKPTASRAVIKNHYTI